jgi:hypothetical protein
LLKSKIMKRLTFFLCALLIAISPLFAQPCPEPPCPPGGDDTPPVPFTGMEMLIAGGILYGAKKIREKKKQNI